MSRFRQPVVQLWGEMSPEQIARHAGCSVATVYGIAKKERLPRRGRRSNHRWTPAEDTLLRETFSVLSVQEVTERFPALTYDQIRSRAKRLGLRSRRSTHLDARRHDFFDTMTPTSSYWAGFIAADGCIHDERQLLSVFLSAKDHAHLQKLSRQLCGSERACLVDGRMGKDKRTTFSIQSPRLVVALREKWNITPRKTTTLSPPPLSKRSDQLAYIGGYLDGDGFIGTYEVGGRLFLRAGALGTRELVTWTADILNRMLAERVREPTVRIRQLSREKYNIPLYEWRCHGRNAQIILSEIHLLIQEHSLARKWDVLSNFSNQKLWLRDRTHAGG